MAVLVVYWFPFLLVHDRLMFAGLALSFEVKKKHSVIPIFIGF